MVDSLLHQNKLEEIAQFIEASFKGVEVVWALSLAFPAANGTQWQHLTNLEPEAIVMFLRDASKAARDSLSQNQRMGVTDREQ